MPPATLLRVTAVEPVGDHVLRLTLCDGSVVERDVGPLMVGEVFEPVRRDVGQFRAVAVCGGTVCWPNGADLCPDVLIWGGMPPETAGATPPAFLRTG